MDDNKNNNSADAEKSAETPLKSLALEITPLINKFTNTIKAYIEQLKIANAQGKKAPDGNAGDTVVLENEQSPKKAFNIKKIIPIVVALILVLSIFKSCGGSSGGGIGGGVSDDMYIGVAEQIIAKSLKKPSSLEVNDAYVYEKDDYGSAIVCMDITSENGFGGADRDTVYVCVMYLESDGSYKYNPSWNYTEDVTNLDFLKSINGFGEPKQ